MVSKFDGHFILHSFSLKINVFCFVLFVFVYTTGSDSTTESNNHLENETPLASDGNQNNQPRPDEVILSKSNSSNIEESNNELNNKSLMKTTINQLKEICEELCSQIVLMKTDGDDVKDKIRVEDVDDDEDDDEEEDDDDDDDDDDKNDDKKCNKTELKDESRATSLLVSELQLSRRIIAELEAKLNALNARDTKTVTVQTDTDELISLNAFNDSCETLHHASVENLNLRKTIDAITQTYPESNELKVVLDHEMNDQPTHIDADKSQLDHSITDRNLDVGSDSVADDMKMLCDPNIEREEQLIAFKEHCAELTETNLLLKNQLNELQTKSSMIGHSTISNRLAVVGPIAIVIICWLILPYL